MTNYETIRNEIAKLHGYWAIIELDPDRYLPNVAVSGPFMYQRDADFEQDAMRRRYIGDVKSYAVVGSEWREES